MLDLTKLSRAEKLLVVATFDVDTEENTCSGHNTEWALTVDLVLEGRKGLFDFTDEELDSELEDHSDAFRDWAMEAQDEGNAFDAEHLLARCRRLSKIQSVDESSKTWSAVDPETQAAWDAEDRETGKK